MPSSGTHTPFQPPKAKPRSVRSPRVLLCYSPTCRFSRIRLPRCRLHVQDPQVLTGHLHSDSAGPAGIDSQSLSICAQPAFRHPATGRAVVGSHLYLSSAAQGALVLDILQLARLPECALFSPSRPLLLPLLGFSTLSLLLRFLGLADRICFGSLNRA